MTDQILCIKIRKNVHADYFVVMHIESTFRCTEWCFCEEVLSSALEGDSVIELDAAFRTYADVVTEVHKRKAEAKMAELVSS